MTQNSKLQYTIAFARLKSADMKAGDAICFGFKPCSFLKRRQGSINAKSLFALSLLTELRTFDFLIASDQRPVAKAPRAAEAHHQTGFYR